MNLSNSSSSSSYSTLSSSSYVKFDRERAVDHFSMRSKVPDDHSRSAPDCATTQITGWICVLRLEHRPTAAPSGELMFLARLTRYPIFVVSYMRIVCDPDS